MTYFSERIHLDSPYAVRVSKKIRSIISFIHNNYTVFASER